MRPARGAGLDRSFVPEPTEVPQCRAGTVDVWCRAGREAVQSASIASRLDMYSPCPGRPSCRGRGGTDVDPWVGGADARRVLVVRLLVGRQRTQVASARFI